MWLWDKWLLRAKLHSCKCKAAVNVNVGFHVTSTLHPSSPPPRLSVRGHTWWTSVFLLSIFGQCEAIVCLPLPADKQKWTKARQIAVYRTVMINDFPYRFPLKGLPAAVLKEDQCHFSPAADPLLSCTLPKKCEQANLKFPASCALWSKTRWPEEGVLLLECQDKHYRQKQTRFSLTDLTMTYIQFFFFSNKRHKCPKNHPWYLVFSVILGYIWRKEVCT